MKKEIIIVSILLSISLISGLYYAGTNSVSTDEKLYITTGYINLYFRDYRFNIEHPPFVKQLGALPLLFMNVKFPYDVYKASAGAIDLDKIQEVFLFKRGNNLDTLLFASRLPSILISLLLGLFIYLFSKKLNGIFAGFISLLCFVFCSNFIAHSSFVTMDVAVSCFYFITIYFLLKYFESKKDIYLFLTGGFLGITLISKYSGLILIPVIYVLAIAGIFLCSSKDKQFNSQLNKWLLILGIPIFILTVAYKGSFRMIFPALLIYALSFFPYKKSSFKNKVRVIGKILLVVLTIGFLFVILDYTDYKWFPLHSPTMAYFKGLAYFIGHAEGGHTAYLLGRYSDKGWWYYFPIAMLLKTPLPTIFLIILGFVGLSQKNKNNWQKLFLVVPFLTYLFVACFINKVNIGVRLILPIYPFLYVIAGYSVNISKEGLKQVFLKLAIFIAIVSLILDVASIYPAHLSYFNILAGGIKNGYKFLGDSNIAWGHNWRRLKKYIENNSITEIKIAAFFGDAEMYNYYAIPYKIFQESDETAPSAGFYAIETTILQKKRIKWAEELKPLKRIGGSLLIYKITKNEM